MKARFHNFSGGVKFIYRTICGIELGVCVLHSLPALTGQFYYDLTLLAKRVFVDSLSWGRVRGDAMT
jgi:hypothetical protein